MPSHCKYSGKPCHRKYSLGSSFDNDEILRLSVKQMPPVIGMIQHFACVVDSLTVHFVSSSWRHAGRVAQAMCRGRLAKGVDESFNRCAQTCEFGARAVRSATHQRSERVPCSGNRRPAWSERLASRRSGRSMRACTEGAQERSFLSGSVTMHIIEQSSECCPLCQRLARRKKAPQRRANSS